MTFKKGIPEVPSIVEAGLIADILDEAGLFEDAELMDQFIKSASLYKDDLIKQAGLWSAIWNRLGGLTKRLFFKEYRQLYSKAKEAQEKLQERIDKIEDDFKQAKKLFNNYDLVGWREAVLAMPVDADDVMADFEDAFGRLVAFTFKLQEKENIPEKEFDVSKITPPGKKVKEEKAPEKKEEKVPEKKEEKVEPEKKLNLDTRFFKEKGWGWSDPMNRSIATNKLTNEIAISRDRYEKMKRVHIVDASTDPNKDYVALAKHDKGFPKGLKEAMGNFIWNVVGADNDWVYLSKVEEEVPEEIAPQEKVEEFAGEPKLQKLPTSLEEAREMEQAKPLEEKPEEVSKEEVKKVQKEKAVEDVKDKKLFDKMMEKEKGKIWISHREGQFKNRFRLIDPKDLIPGKMTVVEDPKLKEALFNALFVENYKSKRRKQVFRVPSQTSDDMVSRADLVNKILFK